MRVTVHAWEWRLSSSSSRFAISSSRRLAEFIACPDDDSLPPPPPTAPQHAVSQHSLVCSTCVGCRSLPLSCYASCTQVPTARLFIKYFSPQQGPPCQGTHGAIIMNHDGATVSSGSAQLGHVVP